MALSTNKQEIRKKLLARRKSLSKEEYAEKSALIIQSLKKQNEFAEAETVHCYISISQNNEVDTLGLIRDMLLKMKRVVVPVMNAAKGTLKHIELVNFNQLTTNAWGVLEPAGGMEVPINELEVIIVPMVGGDRNKNRIGYGKGFYDRFLRQVSCPKIGLLFENCLVEELPVEPFDVPLDKLVTEGRTVN